MSFKIPLNIGGNHRRKRSDQPPVPPSNSWNSIPYPLAIPGGIVRYQRSAGLAIAASLLVPFAAAQTAPAQTPSRIAFEAAEIKPNTSASSASRSHGSLGQVLMENMSLRRILERALEVQSYQLEGPAWMDTVRFDVSAKYPAGIKAEDRPRALRTLLEDRFGLAVHSETRPMPGYALVPVKGGIKAKPSTVDDGTNSEGNGKTIHFTTKGASMAGLATYLGRRLNLIVADRTGAQGLYAFEMTWSVDQDNAKIDDPAPGPSIFNELQSQVGVKLQSTKVPVQVFVVDKLLREPKDN